MPKTTVKIAVSPVSAAAIKGVRRAKSLDVLLAASVASCCSGVVMLDITACTFPRSRASSAWSKSLIYSGWGCSRYRRHESKDVLMACAGEGLQECEHVSGRVYSVTL